MKKLLFLVLALLLGLSTSVFALECSQSPEPQNGGPENCVTSVYNNSGSALDDGDVVVWDVGSSTGDNDNWVTTTTTADTYLVAGVVEGTIAIGDSGFITVKGVTNVDTQAAGDLNTVAGLACSSTTAGAARSCRTNEGSNFGIVTTVGASGTANVCVHCNN